MNDHKNSSAKEIYLSASQQELTYYLETGLPIAVYESNFSPQTYSRIRPHWHSDFQISLVQKGSFVFSTNKNSCEVHAGEAIFINARVFHSGSVPNEKTASYISFEIPPTFLTEQTGSDIYNSYIAPLLDNQDIELFRITSRNASHIPVLTSIFELYKIYTEKEFGFELDLYRSLIGLWKQLLKLLPLKLNTTRKDFAAPKLRRIYFYIQREYMNDISLDDIAENTGFSRSECSRYFKKETGETLFGYLNAYRIEKSLPLLVKTDRPVSEVASAVGFSDQSYFGACFKKKMKMSPLEYRKSQRKAQIDLK